MKGGNMLKDNLTIETPEGKKNIQKILEGDVGFPGDLEAEEFVYGRAVVIAKNTNKLELLKRFKAGEILVTQMTDPSMENEMERAKAFITDRGGETCHAVIIARGLEKVCITATEDATEKIKTGDMVYVAFHEVNDAQGEYWQGRVYKENGLCNSP
jgi:pyruvate,water dikinase